MIKKFFSGRRLSVIVAFCMIVGLIIAVYSCAARVKPDFTISYIGEHYFDSNAFYREIPAVEEKIDDINGDGKKNIEISVISFASNLTPAQEQNNLSKLTFSMGQGESRVYLMDESYCRRYADDEILADLSEYVSQYDNDVLVNDEGKVYGISVSDSALVKALGLSDAEGVYAALRSVTEMDYVNFKNPTPGEMDKTARQIIELILN